MAQAADWLEQQIVDTYFLLGANDVPAQWYLALFDAAPDDTDDMTDEISGGGYARQAINFQDEGGGFVVNDADILFTAMPAGSVVGYKVVDTNVGAPGRVLVRGLLDSSQTLLAGNNWPVPAGALYASVA